MITNIHKNHVCLTSCGDIMEICNPLHKSLGVSWFCYVKQYNDGSRIHLDTNASWVSYFYNNYQRYLNKLAQFEIQKELSSGTYLQDYLPDHMQIIVNDSRNYFNTANSFVLLKAEDQFTELFFLGTTPENRKIVNLYFKYINEIENFIDYFKETAQRLILQAENERLVVPLVKDALKPSTNQEKNIILTDIKLLQKPTHPSKSNSHLFYLTAREIECLRCIATAKTAKESARILKISYKTVEHHIENIKLKLGYRRRSELIKFALTNDL